LAAKDDLSNLLNCTAIGTLFLDLKRRVLRCNPLGAEILNLVAADVGLPFDRTSNNLANCPDLSAEVETVLTTLIGSEREVGTREGLSFLMRIHPYRTLDGRIEGAVISFTGIAEMVHAREALEKPNRHRRLAVVVHDAHDAVVMQDLEGRILAWNPGALRMYGWSEPEALRMNRHTMVPEDLQRQELDIPEKLGRAERVDPYMTRRLTQSGKLLTVELVATSLVNDRAEVYAIATTERTTAGGGR
jgi:two-component system CheB/CheR fusion protein